MMAVKRLSLLALATVLQCVAHGSHEEEGCKLLLEGLYYNETEEGHHINVRVTVDQEHMHFRGTYDDDADKKGFIGRVLDGCKGEMIMDGNPERVAFELYNHTLSFSDGTFWTKKGFKMNSADFKKVYYFGGSHRVATTVAFMFLFLFLMGVLGIGLVRFPDANIRMHTWALVDRAMTVFIAVLINNVMVTIVIDQVIAGKEKRGLDWEKSWKHKAMFTFVYTIMAWATMNIVTWCVKKDRRWRTGAGKLGAHIVGFAALSTAESFMRWFNKDHDHEGGSLEMTVATGVLALVGSFCTKNVGKKVRGCWPDDPDNKHCKRKLAKHQLEHSETEARVLVESFLCAVLTLQMIIGHLPHPEKAESSASWQNVRYISMAAVGTGGLGLVFRMVEQLLTSANVAPEGAHRGEAAASERAEGASEHGQPKVVVRIFTFVVDLTSTWSSWLFYFAGLWTTQLVFLNYDEADTKLVKVVNAFAVTLLGGVAMLIVEPVAKIVAGEQGSSPVSAESQPMLSRSPPTGKLGNSDVAVGMRIFLDSLGIFIALSWEQAFHSTEAMTVEFITEDLEWNHTVLTRLLIASPVILSSLPLWVTFVVPNAEKKVGRHQREIDFRRKMAQKYADGEEDPEEEDDKVP